MMAAQGVQLGDSEVVVAGGMESMSNAPYLLTKAREGYRMGDGALVDAMIRDGLWCAFENYHMGNTGEVVAERYHVTREEQDEYALNSHRKAAAAISAPSMQWAMRSRRTRRGDRQVSPSFSLL